MCSVEPVLLLKHFRYLNHDHFYKRVACRKERLAQAREYSKEVRGWSKHYNRSTEELEKRYYNATKTYADKLVTFEF